MMGAIANEAYMVNAAAVPPDFSLIYSRPVRTSMKLMRTIALTTQQLLDRRQYSSVIPQRNVVVIVRTIGCERIKHHGWIYLVGRR